MLIRIYSPEYGKYLWEQGCAKKRSKLILAKGVFVNVDVYFQNMAIRSCDYVGQGAISHKKLGNYILILLRYIYSLSEGFP